MCVDEVAIGAAKKPLKLGVFATPTPQKNCLKKCIFFKSIFVLFLFLCCMNGVSGDVKHLAPQLKKFFPRGSAKNE